MVGFADTAAFFDSKAKKARVRDDEQRFVETAGFYRALARITPAFPPGYKVPPAKRNGSPQSERWLSRAEECRTLAEQMRDAECRGRLFRLAEGYEAMAHNAHE